MNRQGALMDAGKEVVTNVAEAARRALPGGSGT
jgi:hypothetical protein